MISQRYRYNIVKNNNLNLKVEYARVEKRSTISYYILKSLVHSSFSLVWKVLKSWCFCHWQELSSEGEPDNWSILLGLTHAWVKIYPWRSVSLYITNIPSLWVLKLHLTHLNLSSSHTNFLTHLQISACHIHNQGWCSVHFLLSCDLILNVVWDDPCCVFHSHIFTVLAIDI